MIILKEERRPQSLTWELTSAMAPEFEVSAHAFLYLSIVDFMLEDQYLIM